MVFAQSRTSHVFSFITYPKGPNRAVAVLVHDTTGISGIITAQQQSPCPALLMKKTDGAGTGLLLCKGHSPSLPGQDERDGKRKTRERERVNRTQKEEGPEIEKGRAFRDLREARWRERKGDE